MAAGLVGLCGRPKERKDAVKGWGACQPTLALGIQVLNCLESETMADLHQQGRIRQSFRSTGWPILSAISDCGFAIGGSRFNPVLRGA